MRPASSTTTRSAAVATAASWVTMTIVVPSERWSRVKTTTTFAALAGSRLPVGSSARSTAGRLARARAIATR